MMVVVIMMVLMPLPFINLPVKQAYHPLQPVDKLTVFQVTIDIGFYNLFDVGSELYIRIKEVKQHLNCLPGVVGVGFFRLGINLLDI